MEMKTSKVNFNKSGSGSYSSRVVLPAEWVKKMNINSDSKDIKISFDGEKITIEKA